MIQANGSMVFAFSMTGGFVSAGSGTLVELSGDVTPECTSGFIISGAGGSPLVSEWATGGDDNACDDVDADGVCDDVDDCIGELDECGVLSLIHI